MHIAADGFWCRRNHCQLHCSDRDLRRMNRHVWSVASASIPSVSVGRKRNNCATTVPCSLAVPLSGEKASEGRVGNRKPKEPIRAYPPGPTPNRIRPGFRSAAFAELGPLVARFRPGFPSMPAFLMVRFSFRNSSIG